MNGNLITRPTKHQYYLNLAENIAKRGTCIRRNYGALIVSEDEIISTGYTGSPRGEVNCCDIGKCLREELGIPSGQRYELCRSVHAEMNACLHAGRSRALGSTLYLCGLSAEDFSVFQETMPCELCKRIIINSGVETVIIRRSTETYDIYNVAKDFRGLKPV